ncbi:hypothetical protein FPV67DRAFT_1451746 [Lyophyllum atratum]|nr:hypothetical protein FPV67DRAFT_1456479 [Lyophyllum atratum]KAF8063259.1 hypothetical protein FPV67DRAFT_1451746 [Lyophyllum atratum]
MYHSGPVLMTVAMQYWGYRDLAQARCFKAPDGGYVMLVPSACRLGTYNASQASQKKTSSLAMPPKRQAAIRNPSLFPDRGANYNAFGRDPDGRMAYLAACLWGSDYVPPHTVQQFVGAPEPPRYGPPAPYQRCHLPPGWTPTLSPYAVRYGVPAASDPDLDGPGPPRFHPSSLEALRHVKRFKKRVSKKDRRILEEQAERGWETDIEDFSEDDRTKKRRGFPPPPPPPPPPPAVVL